MCRLAPYTLATAGVEALVEERWNFRLNTRAAPPDPRLARLELLPVHLEALGADAVDRLADAGVHREQPLEGFPVQDQELAITERRDVRTAPAVMVEQRQLADEVAATEPELARATG